MGVCKKAEWRLVLGTADRVNIPCLMNKPLVLPLHGPIGLLNIKLFTFSPLKVNNLHDQAGPDPGRKIAHSATPDSGILHLAFSLF